MSFFTSSRALSLALVLAFGTAAGCASSPPGDSGVSAPSGKGGAGDSGKGGQGGAQASGQGGQGDNGSGGQTGGTEGGKPGIDNGGGGATAGGASGGDATGGAAGGTSGGNDGGTSPSDGAGPGGDQPGTPATPGKQQYGRLVKLDTTAMGANVMADVPKYPVAVVLNAMNFDFTQAKPKGEDVRFTTMDGAALPYAIELWDSTAKVAALWVKVDVKGNAAQSIKMTWGDAGASDASNSAAVFDTKDGFLGAWHLSEAGSADMGNYKDATANAANATGIAVDATSVSDGRMGRAASLLNAKKQYIQIDGDKNQLFDVFDQMTYSIWAKPKSHTVEYQCIFSKGETGFRIHFYGAADWNGGKNLVEICAEEVGGGDFCPINHKGVDVAPGKWFFLAGVQAHPKATSYINGVQEATSTDGSAWTSNPMRAVMIGNNASNLARAFDGVLDEARLMNVAKDANWFKLEYESQREEQKFLTFGETTKN